MGVTLVPRESACDVATVEPLFYGVEEQLLILTAGEVKASDERSTVVLVRRHIFNKELSYYKKQGRVSASTPPTVGRGIRLDYRLKQSATRAMGSRKSNEVAL